MFGCKVKFGAASDLVGWIRVFSDVMSTLRRQIGTNNTVLFLFRKQKISIFEAKSCNYIVYRVYAFSYYDKFN